MAKELEKKAESKKPVAKKKKKFQLGTYLKEMWGEVKKLTWLSPKELAKNTGVVIAVVVAVTILIWVLDLAFGTPMQLLLKNTNSTAEIASSIFLG